jgi:hypothetical protein
MTCGHAMNFQIREEAKDKPKRINEIKGVSTGAMWPGRGESPGVLACPQGEAPPALSCGHATDFHTPYGISYKRIP